MKKRDLKSARDLKKEKVGALSEKIKKAKSIIFTDYRGLTAEQINELRNKIKEMGGELLVTKNSLIKIALRVENLTATSEQLEGPTATVIAYGDEIAPIKSVADANKALGIPTFKFGFFGKDLLDSASLESLAKIPSREILNAKIVGALISPIYAVVSVLNANLRNLVSVLDQAASKTSS